MSKNGEWNLSGTEEKVILSRGLKMEGWSQEDEERVIKIEGSRMQIVGTCIFPFIA